MYNAFFGFTQNPFNMSPDPSFLFRSPQHEEALASLIYGVRSRKGFIALTGEVGTGKTTMLECLRDFLNAQQIAFASLFNSRLTVEQFFELLAYDLDLRCNRLSKTEVLLSLNNMLLERAGARVRVFSPEAALYIQLPMLETTVAVQSTVNVVWRNGLQGDGVTGGELETAEAVPSRCTSMITDPPMLFCLLRLRPRGHGSFDSQRRSGFAPA